MSVKSALARSLVVVGALSFALQAPAADLAPTRDYEGLTIEQIRFIPPSQPVTSAALTQLVPFTTGSPLRLEDVRTAIKRLYATGEYSDVEVETEPGSRGVVVMIRTTEQWFVGGVEVQGKVSQPPKEGQLANATRLELGNPFTDDDLQVAVKGMHTLLQRNGLYLSTVDPKIERDSEHQQVLLTFQVQAGKRARFIDPVVTGETKIPAADVFKATKFKGWFHWKQATQDNTQAGLQGVRKKYEKDERLTASVSLDHVDHIVEGNRVRPTLKAEGGPKIKIRATGAKLSKGKLQTYVPVFDEGTVNRDILVSGVRNLRDYFQNQGYFDVQVDFKTSEVTQDQQDITYAIGLGERHKVVRVDIQGNRYFTAEAVRERMFLQTAGFIRLRHGRYSEGFARRDEDAIKNLYRDNGFRDVKVTTTASDDYKGKKGNVAVSLTIEEGTQYRVAGVTLDGANGGAFHVDQGTMMAGLMSGSGQPFSESSVAADRAFILNTYQSAGYPDAAIDWRMTPGPGASEVSLRYIVAEGQPRYVRDVLITGLRTTRRRLVDPNLLLKAGDPLSWTLMWNTQRRLYDLGVFEKVDMAIQNPQGDTENKYVLYRITEGRRYYLGLGFGAEVARIGGSQTDINAGGSNGFAPRGDLELSRLNFLGLGHSISFKGRYSTLDRRLSLSYLIPRFHNVEGRNITVSGLYDNTRDVLTFTARRLEGSVQVSQKLSKPTVLLLRYTWRDVQVDQSTLKINPLLIPLVAQPARLGIVSATVVQDRRDDPVNAHRGIYNSADFGLVEHYFGGDKNFIRFLGRNSFYKTIHKELVLASNTQFGWIHPFSITAGTDPSIYIPLPERFFGGGNASNRGFPENQAGPRDPTTGFPLGGNALLFHATELRFPFLGDNIDGVLFHDMGNVYSSVSSISFRTHQKDLEDFNYMVHAAGFGIRYKTPVGPVRVDLAYSINPPAFNGLKGTYQQLLLNTATPTIQRVSHFQFFFSIGQAF
jgi:outer membrane protein insertion porin family